MRLFFLLLLSSLSTAIAAQWGLTGTQQWSKDGFRTSAFLEGGSFQQGQEVALDYWFRLKEKRIEFHPTISYGVFEGLLSLPFRPSEPQLELDGVDFRLQEIGFQFKTNIYPFDFGTDCDCPTFGKQGPALHKGFFLQLAPGISYLSVRSQPNYYSTEAFKDQAWLPTLGLGAGIDFGVSKFLTVSPTLTYRRSLGQFHWQALEQIDDLPFEYGSSKAHLAALQFSIRLGFRLDHRRW